MNPSRFHQALWAAIELAALFGGLWGLVTLLTAIAPMRMPA